MSDLNIITSSLLMYINTNDLSTLWADINRTTPATIGLPVMGVTDKSPNNNHWSQSNSTLAPILAFPASPVKNYSLRFTGTGTQKMMFANQMSTIRTVYWFIREDAGAGSGYRFLLGDTTNYDFSSGGIHECFDNHYSPIDSLRIDKTPVSVLTNRPITFKVITASGPSNMNSNNFSDDRTYNRSWFGDLGLLLVYSELHTDQQKSDNEDAIKAYFADLPTPPIPIIFTRKTNVVKTSYITPVLARKNKIEGIYIPLLTRKPKIKKAYSANITNNNANIGQARVVNFLQGINLGGPIDLYGSGSFGRYLQLGIQKNNTEGNPLVPSLEISYYGMWRFRWVIKAGSRTISINAKCPSTSTPRPSINIKANPSIGIPGDINTYAPSGTDWVTIGPVSINPTTAGVVWVELWNNVITDNTSPVYFDHITVG